MSEPRATGPDPATAAVHAGRLELPTNTASSPPLFQASSYEFADLEDVEAIYAGTRAGRIYGRYGGPNGAAFESAIATLEGAEDAVGAAAGMSAIDASLLTSVPPGGTILATREIYGGTFALLENDYRNSGFRVVYVDQSNLVDVAEALARESPAVLYVEALTNPLVGVADLPGLAELAARSGATLIVDATFASPALVRPLALGADLVVHSVGKYIGGHGDVGAGVVAGSRERIAAIRGHLVRRGATIPHFEAWLAHRGLRTLALRMQRHSENAREVAAFLAGEPAVARVHHPSRPDHAQHALADRLYPRGTGGIVAFDLAGGAPAVDAFLRGLRMIAIVHSLGEVATTIAYPAVSSHRPLPAEVRRSLGVGNGTLRISAGIERADDIVADLARAFAGLDTNAQA
jgi:cystathionine beta-lyase/cystathionine gamma-synthase